jgi:5-methylthioadenosine/S-adenosylhomocysteine deaminase
MYWHGGEVARAFAEAGLRAVVSAVLIDGLDPGRGERLRDDALASLDRISAHAPLVEPSFGPHAIYTVSEPSLRWLGEVAAARKIPVQIHLAETGQEVADCVDAHGMRPAAYLDRTGLLGERTVLAHGVWLDDDELELVADRGATVVTNPAANMKLAVGGAFPYPRAAARGVRIGLGTDGVSSNNNLDLFEEVKLLALIQKHAAGDPAVLPAAEALAIARGLRSPLLGGTPLEVGAPADFVLLRAGDPELSAGDRDAGQVYAASGAAVDTTVVAGRILMRDRVVSGVDEVVAEVRERAARLTESQPKA